MYISVPWLLSPPQRTYVCRPLSSSSSPSDSRELAPHHHGGGNPGMVQNSTKREDYIQRLGTYLHTYLATHLPTYVPTYTHLHTERILLENIEPWWVQHSIDDDEGRGGYLMNHDMGGRWMGPTDKMIVTQCRAVGR